MTYTAYRPKDGFVWNPLRDFPRNEACFCGAMELDHPVKFKKCHGRPNALKPCVSTAAAKKLKRFFELRKTGRAVRLVLEDSKVEPHASEVELDETQQKSLKDNNK